MCYKTTFHCTNESFKSGESHEKHSLSVNLVGLVFVYAMYIDVAFM